MNLMQPKNIKSSWWCSETVGLTKSSGCTLGWPTRKRERTVQLYWDNDYQGRIQEYASCGELNSVKDIWEGRGA